MRMNIGVTFKRYRAIKEVGKIIMSVGVIAYYQLMQVCQVHLIFSFPFSHAMLLFIFFQLQLISIKCALACLIVPL